ncbi:MULTISPECIES: CIA30 family protein [Pseudomonadati]|uniref:CIA30 family protein n=1 Tax=Shewanella aestuarii TaxID=1028752 RepID=A0ABT0L259_9GAMM|nr:CIA30 family protein [Shewanella aestuarii]MCL1117580.1 CIA30 family protein [Shewanella aestuarii]GGN75272.1 exonuclease [Shewanella aestuarii]
MIKFISASIFCIFCHTALAANLSNEETMRLNFAKDFDLRQIQINNDTVMGGLSSSRISINNNAVNFSGLVSLDNNGGFASTQFNVIGDIPDTIRCKLIVKGDGKRYQLRLKTAALQFGEAFIAEFTTLDGEISEHIFTIDDFRIGFRGRTIQNGPALDFAKVKQVGILIADKQQGGFSIDLHTVAFEQ